MLRSQYGELFKSMIIVYQITSVCLLAFILGYLYICFYFL